MKSYEATKTGARAVGMLVTLVVGTSSCGGRIAPDADERGPIVVGVDLPPMASAPPPSDVDGGEVLTDASTLQDTSMPAPPPAPSADAAPPPYPLADCMSADGSNVMVLDGEPGNPLHPGKEVMTSAAYDFSGGYFPVNNTLDMFVWSPRGVEQWTARFVTQHPEEPPQLGVYDPAVWPDYGYGTPLLHVSRNAGVNGSCDVVVGRFVIHSVVIDPSSRQLLELAATFEERCDGVAAALRGCVAYHYP